MVQATLRIAAISVLVLLVRYCWVLFYGLEHPGRFVRLALRVILCHPSQRGFCCQLSPATCFRPDPLPPSLRPYPCAGEKHVPAVMKAGHTPAEVGEEGSDEDMFAPPTPGAPADRAMSGALPEALTVIAA